MNKVIVVGSINVDICGYVRAFPVPGETVVGNSLSIGVGGKGNNQATAAKRAGADVVFISKVGNDFLRDIAVKHLVKENIDMTYIPTIDGETGSAVIEVEEVSGQNRIAIKMTEIVIDKFEIVYINNKQCIQIIFFALSKIFADKLLCGRFVEQLGQ